MLQAPSSCVRRGFALATNGQAPAHLAFLPPTRKERQSNVAAMGDVCSITPSTDRGLVLPVSSLTLFRFQLTLVQYPLLGL